jgi:hypothetical protein
VRLPFARIEHFVTVPVSVGDVETRFVLDTGIGLTMLAETLCERASCTPTGDTFSGSRMSGQDVSLPLGRIPSLAFGDLTQPDVVVGILDMSGFPNELSEIGGFLSLASSRSSRSRSTIRTGASSSRRRRHSRSAARRARQWGSTRIPTVPRSTSSCP